MIVVYCLDENYRRWTDISIKSVRKFNPDAKIILVTEKPMSMWRDDIQNFVIPLNKRFRNKGQRDRITNAAYLKLFLPEIAADKIIYLDGDTIIQSPLKPLWDMPCDYINLCESHQFGKLQANAINTEKYGLTGMMVMNLNALRQIKFTEKCLEVESSGFTPATGWQHDETCINIAMKGLLSFIPVTWNYCRGRDYSAENTIPIEQANIVHYIGRNKNDMQIRPCWDNITPIKKAIRGKSVAIVGNAASLFDFRYGKEIDNHDFIIRFNKGFITRPECQGTRTNWLICACLLKPEEFNGYHADFMANRSSSYINPFNFTLSNRDRMTLKARIGRQPSTGFMAIDVCLTAGAKNIDLYGFDFEKTPTFYNPPDYKTDHDYRKEREIVLQYQDAGLLQIKGK